MSETMNSILVSVTQTINNIIVQNPMPAADESLRAHLTILDTTEGSSEEKLRELLDHTNQQVLDILESAGPEVDGHMLSEQQIHILSAHMAVGDMVATLLESAENS